MCTFHIDPKHTNFINRIIEGCEYLGVMTSVDTNGRCMLRCTPSTRPLALEVLSSLSDWKRRTKTERTKVSTLVTVGY